MSAQGTVPAFLLYILIISWACGEGIASASVLGDLVEQGQYEEAYAQARQQMAERAGEAEFDFYYGLAALETGHVQEAIFAFERATVAAPQNQRVRLELARAYFAGGQYEPSERLFRQVLAAEPPPNVKEKVESFLAEIKKRTARRTYNLNAHVGMKLGLDSNVNSATDLTTVTLPAFNLSVPLNGDSRERDDEFVNVIAGADYIHLMRKDIGLFTSVDWDERMNSTYDRFNMRVMNVAAGGIYSMGGQTWRLPVQYQYVELDHHHYREMTTLGLEWSLRLAKEAQAVLFGQWGAIRYETEPLRDAELTLAGGAWSTPLGHLPLKLVLSFYYGNEDDNETRGAHFGRDYVGGRTELSWKVRPDQEVRLVALVQPVKYAAVHPTFLKTREDDYRQLAFHWYWRPQSHWRVGLNIEHTDNQSNIGLYGYKRTLNYVSVRYSY